MIIIITCGILIAIVLGRYAYSYCDLTSSFAFGFLGFLCGLLIGLLICTLVCAAICCDPGHIVNTETYPLIQINMSNDSEVLASNYILKGTKSNEFTVYIFEDDAIIPLEIESNHIHFIITDTAEMIKKTYHFKTKICRLLFEYADMCVYDCYIPMQPLTSS